jgi:cation transporter family protein
MLTRAPRPLINIPSQPGAGYAKSCPHTHTHGHADRQEYSVQLTLRQEWTDDRLAFGTMRQYKDYGLNSITLTEQERIWKPDLFFRNEKEGHFHKIIMPNVLLRIKSEGQVLYSIRISLVLACPMDLKYYPLDKQNCTIEMASYGYLDEDLKFLWKEQNPVQIAKPLNLPRFTLETYDTAYCTSRTTTGAYSCLRIDLIFKREFSYYLIQIYIPCCMLVIVSWVSFWLDPNAIPARVSLGVTTLLTMATQISGINASLPPVSYTKAIDVWTGVCLTFVFGALLEFALVNYASRSDQHKREMLTSALTQTQQMRWREATAAAAAAGTAPPLAPPPDENSPSMLARKGQPAAFFGPAFVDSIALGQPPGAKLGRYQQQQQQQRQLAQPPDNQMAADTDKPAALTSSGSAGHQPADGAKTSAAARRGIAILGARGSLRSAPAGANKGPATGNRTNFIQTLGNNNNNNNCPQQSHLGHGAKLTSPYINCGPHYPVSASHSFSLHLSLARSLAIIRFIRFAAARKSSRGAHPARLSRHQGSRFPSRRRPRRAARLIDGTNGAAGPARRPPAPEAVTNSVLDDCVTSHASPLTAAPS